MAFRECLVSKHVILGSNHHVGELGMAGTEDVDQFRSLRFGGRKRFLLEFGPQGCGDNSFVLLADSG